MSSSHRTDEARVRRNWRPMVIAAAMFGAAVGHVAPAAADDMLKAPFDAAEIRAAWSVKPKTYFTCRPVPKTIVDVGLGSKYREGTNSTVIDPNMAKKHNKLSSQIREFTRPLVQMANAYIVTTPSDQRIAACAGRWLAVWARENGVEEPDDRPGEAFRVQALSASAMAYLQIADSPAIPMGDRVEIEGWLRGLAERVRKDFSTDMGLASRNNNHSYWAGWSVMAAAIAVNDRSLYDWAVGQLQKGLDAVSPEGFLPEELERRQLAMGYHFYAAEPLTMLMAAAKANGNDLWPRNNVALQRLVRTAVAGLADPTPYERITGYKQEDPTEDNANKIAFILLYSKWDNSPAVLAEVGNVDKFNSDTAGGDIKILYGRPDAPRS